MHDNHVVLSYDISIKLSKTKCQTECHSKLMTLDLNSGILKLTQFTPFLDDGYFTYHLTKVCKLDWKTKKKSFRKILLLE